MTQKNFSPEAMSPEDVRDMWQELNALRKSEKQYREIVELAVDGILIHSHEGVILSANESICRLLQMPKEKIVGNHISALSFMPGALDIAPLRFDLLQKGETVTREITFLRPDVSEVIVKMRSKMMPNKTHQTICHDITAYRRMEATLVENEHFLRASQKAAHIGSYATDLITREWKASPETYRIFGIDPSHPNTLEAWVRIIHPDSRGKLFEYHLMVEKEKIPFDYEYRIIRQNTGEERWVHGLGGLEFDRNMNPIRMLGTIQDITDRRRAEEALKESEERYRTIFENTGTAMILIEEDMTISMANGKFIKSTGLTAEQVIGKLKWSDFAGNGDLQHMMALHKRRRENPDNVPTAYEFRYKTKNGGERDALLSIQMVPGTRKSIASLIDINRQKKAEIEKKKLEDQLYQAQKMESIGRLAGGVAHDFNNMLGVILGYAEMALLQIAPEKPERHYLAEIRKAAERSADLTRQLLSFARKQTIAPKLLNLNETIEGMFQMIRRLIGENIHLDWRPGENLWMVNIDPSQIDQIIMNLSVNARDAISGIGEITMETGNIILDEHYSSMHAGFSPGEYVRISISDNGCGMDKEMLSHIFEPFFTTKNAGKGTGLGLATVYGAVKQNNGFINAYSEPDKGSAITIYLPRHTDDSADSTGEKSGAEASSLAVETILLVEDEPSILEVTTIMLEMEGYNVLAAKTPGEAIRMAKEHAGDACRLLLTDVVMPEMNGRDLAKNILSLYPDIKRLFMSGYTANVIAHQGVLDEGVHFIQKPFSSKELSAKIREVLGRN